MKPASGTVISIRETAFMSFIAADVFSGK